MARVIPPQDVETGPRETINAGKQGQYLPTGKIILNYEPESERKPEAKKGIRKTTIHTTHIMYRLIQFQNQNLQPLSGSLSDYACFLYISQTLMDRSTSRFSSLELRRGGEWGFGREWMEGSLR